MSGTPCEHNWYERVEEEIGQEPMEPIQLDGVTEDKDKGQERADIEEIENNDENKEETKKK